MELNSLFLTMLFTLSMSADPIKVAVIDTGVNSMHKLPLCKEGHVDFSKKIPVEYTSKELYEGKWEDFRDNESHGTNISHLLHKHAGKSNYCQMIIKYIDGRNSDMAYHNTIKAYKHAIKHKVHIINYSSNGTTGVKNEKSVIKDIIKAKIILVTSAGNYGMDLNKGCKSYPACYYKDTLVVGSGFDKTKPASYSNTGDVIDVWIEGSHQKANGTSMSGTSQSTAIATGKLVRMIDKLRNFLNE